MKKITLLFLSLFLVTNILGAGMELPIVPKPKAVKIINEKFLIKKEIAININGVTDGNSDFTAELISQSLNDNLKIKSKITKGAKNVNGINLVLDKNFSLPSALYNDESYSLNIKKDGVEIKANSAKGLFYGAMSLIQLIDRSKNNELIGVEITDTPDMKFRGISDDLSRGQVSTLDNFKKIIRNIARYKMNVYMPYLEDMVKFDEFPTIGVNRGALSKDEIKELVTYAKKYFIDIIPVFQTLGHYENILSQPEFLKYAEFTGAASLSVSYDSTYVFLEHMLKTVFELFPSEYFNMGADESYDVGQGKSKYLVDSSSIAIVHANHYKKVYDICKKYNKKVFMYGDIILSHPEILDLLPKDITIVDWHYRAETDYPSTRTFKKAGINYLVSPSVWNFLTTFPSNLSAFPNIKYIIKAGLQNGSIGMINSNWGDFGSETFKEFIFLGYAWSAQCSWNIEGSDAGKFAVNYFSDFFGSDDSRIPFIYESLENPFNHFMWHEVWRHPLLPQREPMFWEAKMPQVGRISWIEYSMPSLLNNIEAVEKTVTKNKDHFELLKYMVKLNLWFKTKLETQALLQDKMKNPDKNISALLPLVEKNISELKLLKADYKTLWLKYYKPENLSLIEAKFDRLAKYFDEVKNQLQSNTALTSPLISSKWIYSTSDDDSTLVKTASFKKEISLDEAPSSALLQLMGDTYVKLYINGNFVDEVYVRRSLSLVGEHKRIKLLDITKYLQKGTNIFTVEAETHNRTVGAGVNIISEITSGSKKITLLTDETWQTKNAKSDWKNAVAKHYSYEIIAPDFSSKRTSWIER